MKLSPKDFEFNNPRICHVMPKHIELDRLMINLYMLLKYGGRRPVARTGRKQVTVETIAEQLLDQHGHQLPGFRNQPELLKDWIHSDLVDIVFRGVPDKEVVAAPLPLHLNAFKLRNPKQAQDYRSSEQIFSLIQAGDAALIKRLADFLGQGMDHSTYDTYDDTTALDLDTLMVVRMVDNPTLQERPASSADRLQPPLCPCQARLLTDDLRRLLAYQDVVPRAVLIGYLRTVLGLHLGLFLLRLFHQLAGWTRDRAANPGCLACAVHPTHDARPLRHCPYAFQNEAASSPVLPEILVDMGEDPGSHMARLARENCARHYASMNEYIEAVLTVNQLFQFADSTRGRRLGLQMESIAGVLELLRDPPHGFDEYFENRIDDIVPPDDADEERAEVRAIRNMHELSPLQTFVELVALERTQYYRKYLTEQLDSVLMKNRDTGLLRQGKGKRNERRWTIGSRLLEVFVQLAVLEPVGGDADNAFRSRPILIDEFVTWLRERYGIVLMPQRSDATIDDYQAYNDNLRHLKVRLREIGFYTDLSDAYNAQTIRPRYAIDGARGG